MVSMHGRPTRLLRSAPRSESELEEYLSEPSDGTIATMRDSDGDLLVLGAGGKLGLSLCRLARRSLDAAGKSGTRVIAVSRFGERSTTKAFDAARIETLSSDLMTGGALER